MSSNSVGFGFAVTGRSRPGAGRRQPLQNRVHQMGLALGEEGIGELHILGYRYLRRYVQILQLISSGAKDRFQQRLEAIKGQITAQHTGQFEVEGISISADAADDAAEQ